MTYQPKFCTRLKEQRKQLGLSQEGAAKVLKVGLRTYQRWELGSAVPNYPARFGVTELFNRRQQVHDVFMRPLPVPVQAFINPFRTTPEPPLQPVSGDLTPAVEQVPGAAEEPVQNQQEERQENEQSADQGQSEAERADAAQ